MAERGPAFGASDYVVQYGLRDVLVAAVVFGGWLAAGLALLSVRAKPPGVLTDLIFVIGLIGIALAGFFSWRRARSGEVAFAVHSGGVYFGHGPLGSVNVGWDRVIAIEYFAERRPGVKTTTTYRCVGVRGTGTKQPHRPGSGDAAQPLPASAEKYLLAAGRPDLIPGHDGTVRLAYRRMSGWRAAQGPVADALARFAPSVPIINSPAWPPELTRADALTARRARRA